MTSVFRRAHPILGLLLCGACAPTTHPIDNPPDLVVPADLAGDANVACQGPPGNTISNPGFEVVPMATVNNTAGGMAGPLEPWRGCCGASVTSTWTVSTMMPHCGMYSIMLQSTAGASQNVLFQNLTLTGASGGDAFTATAYVDVTTISSGMLLIDIQDTGVSPSVTIAQSSTLTQVTPGWIQLTTTGTLPNHGAGVTPSVQFRFNDTGPMTAFLDDAALVVQ